MVLHASVAGPRPITLITGLAPYATADTPADGSGAVLLAQNESLRPPSPAAVAAASAALARGARYPDADWAELRAAIADVHAVAPERLLIGVGSMELIAALAAAYVGEGDAALASAYGYLYFRTATRLAGARIDLAPEPERRVDIDQLLSAVRPETRLVFVANPGNPTGSYLAGAELERLRAALPARVLLVIDEAYGEFAPDGGAPRALIERDDVVLLRTFSKAYGLAGFRVGWGVFPPAVAAELRKTLKPNNVCAASQAAAAAAMRDQAYMRETVALTAAERTGFIERVRALGVAADDSFANFALLRFGAPAEAEAVEAALRRGGVYLRAMGGYGLPACLRATIGTPEEMRAALNGLAAALKETRGTGAFAATGETRDG